ncbi:T9SS type A sorting domain-containing protein [Flavobacterium aquicola]|uniref:Putative secreted protein (Por secretion system target) n=1 Tax=Flavobacterium aquicola TaxID=1682742 RepID=A0A3E0DZ52_9FLAO|nr:T9SS type A sorting domain-containing protein [Flavobacterium aquicola]REG90733.1 putative secreted protein (Por secretion system target) [Flavobacterium aquicola]
MKTKLLSLLLLLAVSKGFAQYTIIPDTNFEAKLIALGIDDTADGQVLTSNINTLTQIDLSSSSITNMTGIQDFTALTNLNCEYNTINNLDISKNAALDYLNCNNNQLTALDISQNPLLRILYFTNNRISSIDLSEKLLLRYVMCNQNKITSLDVSKNKTLEYLDCSSNKLTILDVSQNAGLTQLYCRNNELTTLNLKNGKNSLLVRFEYYNNKNLSCIIVDDVNYMNTNWRNPYGITPFFSPYECSLGTQIPNSQFEDKLIALGIDTDGKNGIVLNSSIGTVASLDLSNSSIADLTGIQGFTALTTLNVSNNSLNTVDLSKNTFLNTLDCSNNTALTCIQVADIAAAGNWSTTKDAAANFSLDCNAYTIIPDANFEATLIKLKIDDVADGRVQTSKINQVWTLEINNSQIVDLTGIQDFTSLTSLYCVYTQITSLDLSKNTALKSLNCYGNKLTSLDLSKNTVLTSVDCSSNKLTSLDVTQNTALKYLTCNWNELTALDISQNINLVSLSCGRNRIKILDASKNTSLYSLSCDVNKLTNLNIKNGYNTSLSLSFSENPDLSCISVDDVAYADTKWGDNKNANSYFTTYDCSASTGIPDPIFEDKLIALGIDTDGKNGQVLNSSIETLTALDVSNTSITDLNGIQGFTALTTLNCSNNLLNKLDVSKNGALTALNCSGNASLTCIQVSDITAANKWSITKDSKASFGLDCRDYTLIPDTSFEAKLISLGIDDIADGKVLTSNVNKLRELSIYESSITDLTGIQDFTALVDLTCYNNQITKLDVSKNTQLKYLYCSDNKITSLDVSKNTLLQVLSCSNNLITSLDVSTNTVLSSLYCNENQITNLDISKNTLLEIFNCSSNQITSLDVTKNIVLRNFYCNNNKLTSLNLKNGNNTNFQFIGFYSNSSLSCINVDDADYSNTNWRFKKDDTAFYTAYECSVVTGIPDPVFEDKLIALGIDTDGKNGNVLNSSIEAVTSLDVSNSAIANLSGIQGFTALTTLECSKNTLTTLDISKNTALTTLGCSENQLTALDLSKNTALTDLNNNSNQLTALDVSGCVSLTKLNVSSNNLAALDVSKNTALTNLQSNSNQLISLDVSKNVALTNLNCSSNQLTALDVSANTNLTELILSNNPLLKSLNLKNGNNSKLSEATISFTDNPSLKCIQVDDKLNADTNWAAKKDATANYSEDCNPFTSIPDSNFEDKLIALGIDTDGKNGKVLIESINTVTTLDVSSANISDLTGIQKFIALTALNCSSNKLISLDISQNIALIDFNCSSNNLTSLNCKNGSNTQLAAFEATNNPNLTCIQVDDAIFANEKWTAKKDVAANFNTDCASSDLYTYIPDLNFENKLIELAIDSSPADGKVLTSNINALTSLNISGAAITNLKGIEAFSALTNLECNANELTNLDLSKNTALTDLNCSTNQLNSLDLSKNTILTKLNASSNQLTALDLSKNTALTDVVLSANQLTVLDISKNTVLVNLGCNFNQLTGLNTSKNTALTTLNLNSNQLTTLDISKNTALINLNCSSNKLTGLDAGNNINLEALVISNNPLLVSLNLKNGNNSKLNETSINFTDNPKLKCIQVDDKIFADTNWADKKDGTANYNEDCDPFTAIPDSNFEDKLIALGIDTDGKNGKVLIESIITVTALDVSSSDITDLTGIQKFEALTSLNCSSNQITTLDVSKNKLLTDLNCSSNNLASLNCKNTNNSQMSSFNATNNPNLTCIQVDNAIYARTNWTEKKDAVANFNTDCATADLYTYIPDLNFENKLIALTIDSSPADGKVLTSSINTLTSLNVSDASIPNLKGIEAFSALTNLDCSGNQLIALDLSKNTALTDLNCSSNQLKTLDLSKNTALSNLSLKNNMIESLDITQNTELTFVDCSNNTLTSLNVDKNIKLTKLICQNNQLSALNVKNNTALTLLDFSKNQVTSIDLTKNKALTQLFCDSNKLPSLNITQNTALTELNCSSNQLTSLNLKNGNNTNFNSSALHLENNPNLGCIKVDNKTYSDTNWSVLKDATAFYDPDCGLSLPSNNFIVETKGESCLGENNGEINITASETFLYTASINGTEYPFTNNTLSVTNLAPRNYTVSITIPGETFEQNFNIIIAKGASITGKSSIISKKVNIQITTGTAPYTVFVDGIEQFETNDPNFSLTANGGSLLEVKTAKACEGIYAEDITGLNLIISAYPNPTSGSFEIELPVTDKEATIEINATNGRVISSKKYSLENGTAQLTLENEPSGVYIAKIHLAGSVKNVKIIKN